jgi:IS30 family transposase
MGTNYEQLPDEERATIMVMTQAGQSLRAMARILHRVPSTISREWRRHAEAAELGGTSLYSAKQAGQERDAAGFSSAGSASWPLRGSCLAWSTHFLQEGWSPAQIAGTLKLMWLDSLDRRVAAETIYTCLYALPRGTLRQELIACLRKARSTRLPRARGTDRRSQLTDMLSIHLRPPEVDGRALPGHWEGDFIKGRVTARRWGFWSSAARDWCCWPKWTMPPPLPPWRATPGSSTASPHRYANR